MACAPGGIGRPNVSGCQSGFRNKSYAFMQVNDPITEQLTRFFASGNAAEGYQRPGFRSELRLVMPAVVGTARHSDPRAGQPVSCAATCTFGDQGPAVASSQQRRLGRAGWIWLLQRHDVSVRSSGGMELDLARLCREPYVSSAQRTAQLFWPLGQTKGGDGVVG